MGNILRKLGIGEDPPKDVEEVHHVKSVEEEQSVKSVEEEQSVKSVEEDPNVKSLEECNAALESQNIPLPKYTDNQTVEQKYEQCDRVVQERLPELESKANILETITAIVGAHTKEQHNNNYLTKCFGTSDEDVTDYNKIYNRIEENIVKLKDLISAAQGVLIQRKLKYITTYINMYYKLSANLKSNKTCDNRYTIKIITDRDNKVEKYTELINNIPMPTLAPQAAGGAPSNYYKYLKYKTKYLHLKNSQK